MKEATILSSLRDFASSIKKKFSLPSVGEPEDQLRGPFEVLLQETGKLLSLRVVCSGEALLADRIGKPDFAVAVNKALVGYVEMKAPGTGADPAKFKGHDKAQWNRFKVLPNLLYCDGNEWGLYRNGERIGKLVSMEGDVTEDGSKAVGEDDAKKLLPILTDFLRWEPIVPKDAKGLAELLAPLCRMLREDVTESLRDEESALVNLAEDWRQLLFPGATNDKFADAYAQTVTFALLLARSEGANPLTLESAQDVLDSEHSLLSRALQVLTDKRARKEISASLNLLLRVVGAVSSDALTGPRNPWLYFYEDFLTVYDPILRKDVGAYYTPAEVVHAQVKLIDELLVNRLNRKDGFADRDVITLDPALGTGTYLLGVIEQTLKKIEEKQGKGAVAARGASLAENLYGFEIMVGPYAVAELRISRALMDRRVRIPKKGLGVFLTDTLEAPGTVPPKLPTFLEPIAEQHKRALQVKSQVPVIVCLGNPPYDRHEAAEETNKARTGGWVRWGDEGTGKGAILKEFLDPAITAGHGKHVKNLYNLYVYFWRWALWKVFDYKTASGSGIVSFISASSYLEGDAFAGMREYMRRVCDEIWIIDLGGEGRGTRKTENVFNIQTPVAIAIAARYKKSEKEKPADVHYTIIEGSREEKLSSLSALSRFEDLKWETCPKDWQAPFRPKGKGKYFQWPLLTDLFPWQHSGVECKRTWPIAPLVNTLERRWKSLLVSEDKANAFRGSGDREVTGKYNIRLTPDASTEPIASLPSKAPSPPIVRYAFRSFDRQYLFADGRMISRPRPDLWEAHGNKQIYVTTLFNHPLGNGPAMTACYNIPDRHHFRGSYGGKDIIPLYRDSKSNESSISTDLLQCLNKQLGIEVLPEDLLSYTYGILAHPDFTRRFADNLKTREIRVPITKDRRLFQTARDIGKRLLWLHTYGERFVPTGKRKGVIPTGTTKCTKAVPESNDRYPEKYSYDAETKILRVGDGEFGPVAQEVWDFEVSGLRVVKSWLDYRMKAGHGKKSSPLDDIRPERWTSEFTTELLELLWVLEATLAEYPKQKALLEEIIKGSLFQADELPEVPAYMRNAPSQSDTASVFDQEEKEED
jgi:hypothetical protein